MEFREYLDGDINVPEGDGPFLRIAAKLTSVWVFDTKTYIRFLATAAFAVVVAGIFSVVGWTFSQTAGPFLRLAWNLTVLALGLVVTLLFQSVVVSMAQAIREQENKDEIQDRRRRVLQKSRFDDDY